MKTYEQMKEHAEGMQRDYDLLLAEYNLLKQETGDWQQYAKEGETAQEVIERTRADLDAFVNLYLATIKEKNT